MQTFDFSGLQAQGPAKKGVPQKVALDNTVKSFSLVAKGPNSKCVLMLVLRQRQMPCACRGMDCMGLVAQGSAMHAAPPLSKA